MKSKEPEWYYCNECDAWIGSTPPFLPHLWTNDRAAAAHWIAMRHKAEKVTADQLIPTPKGEESEFEFSN